MLGGFALAQMDMNAPIEYVIRKANLADVPAIACLAAEFAQYLRGLGDTTEFRLNVDALERDGFGPEPAFGGVVAEMAGVVIGYLLYHDGYDTDAAYRLLMIADLFVTQAARGRGSRSGSDARGEGDCGKSWGKATRVDGVSAECRGPALLRGYRWPLCAGPAPDVPGRVKILSLDAA